MKKTIQEAIIIIILASGTGFVYNYFSSKPLPLIYTPKKLEVASDSLFNQIGQSTVDSGKIKQDSSLNTTAATTVEDTSKPTQKALKDTTKTQNQSVVVGSKLGAIKTITMSQLKKHLNDKNFLVIDARKPEDYQTAHIGNAINIDPYEENKDSYFRKLTSLPNDNVIVVYCSGGQCEASHHVVEDLVSFGYTKVFLFAGGWEEWTKAK